MKTPIKSIVRIYSSMSIKSKLFLYISLVMLLALTISVGALYYAYSIYDRQIYEKSSQILNLSSGGIEAELKKIARMSFGILSDSEVQSTLLAIHGGVPSYEKFQNRNSLKTKLVQYFNSEHYVMSVHLIDALNNEIFVNGQSVTIPDEKLKRIRQETHLAGGKVRWFYPDGNDPAVILAREIRAYEDMSLTPIGTLMIRIHMEKLIDDLAANARMGEGQFLIMSGEERIFPNLEPDGGIPAGNATPDEEAGYEIYKRDGDVSFISYIRSSYTGWTYYNVMPFGNTFKSIILMKNMLIFVFLVSFAALFIIGAGLTRGITRPIERLTGQMKTLQKGGLERVDPSTLAPVSAFMDEVGVLNRTFRMMMTRIHELIRENYVKQLIIKETEFKALQAQINPHFLYNTLATIDWMAQMSGQKPISRVVVSLGFLLRSSISNKEPLIPIREELEIVRNYITIQKTRFEEQLDFGMDVTGEIGDYLIPKLSLQPIVENAINYGLEEMIGTCVIRIRGSVRDGCIRITVEDNGPGTNPKLIEKLYSGEIKARGSGIGLRNIDERLKLLFGEEFGVTVESGPGRGTCVSLRLPMRIEVK
ncbi:sensor histidine kinase [Paenibacillus tarimensis]